MGINSYAEHYKVSFEEAKKILLLQLILHNENKGKGREAGMIAKLKYYGLLAGIFCVIAGGIIACIYLYMYLWG